MLDDISLHGSSEREGYAVQRYTLGRYREWNGVHSQLAIREHVDSRGSGATECGCHHVHLACRAHVRRERRDDGVRPALDGALKADHATIEADARLARP